MNSIDLQHILFLDIETVSGVSHFEELSEQMQYLWADKTKWQRKAKKQEDKLFWSVLSIKKVEWRVHLVILQLRTEKTHRRDWRLRNITLS